MSAKLTETDKRAVAMAVAAALLAPLGTHAAEATAASCKAVSMELRFVDPLTETDSTLDMQGRWYVSSWDGLRRDAERLRRMSPRPDNTTLWLCIATELLARRDSLPLIDAPDTRCPESPTGFSIWEAMNSISNQIDRIMRADPVVRACMPKTTCDPDDVCS